MTPVATGRVIPTAKGRDLVITRAFRAPIEDMWASITEPERTARWFGPWRGTPGVGNTIEYQMVFEGAADPPWSETRIVACEAPHHLELYSESEYGVFHLEFRLTEANGITALRFMHHMDAKGDVGAFGAGWEYYFDNLVASRDGAAMPDFNDYYPSMKPHFEEQLNGE